MLISVDFSQVVIGTQFTQNGNTFEKHGNDINSMNSFNLTKKEAAIVSGLVEIEAEEEEKPENWFDE